MAVDFTDAQPASKSKIPAEPARIRVARGELMSVNVRQHCGAVKTKIVISAALALAVLFELAQAGPQIGISARAGAGWCAPASTVCPPFKPSPKFVTCAWPTYYYPWSYGYVSSPISASTSFSNVSPVFENGQTGIYRVPTPIISPSPVITPAGPAFGWQR
jgi:hypothetical protein